MNLLSEFALVADSTIRPYSDVVGRDTSSVAVVVPIQCMCLNGQLIFEIWNLPLPQCG